MAIDHLDNKSLIGLEDVVHGNMVTLLARALGDPAAINGMANMSFWILEGLLIEVQAEKFKRGMSENKHCANLLSYISAERQEMSG